MKPKTRNVASLLLVIALVMTAALFRETSAQNPPQQEPRPLPDAPRSPATPKQKPTPVTAQQSTAAEEKRDDDIVRITTNLVQIDVVVTDNNGNQITNLTADDFEILEDSQPQKITNFSFIDNESPSDARTTVATTTANRNVAPAVTGSRPQDAKRTIALVIDDLKMSFESAVQTRKAVRKFIDSQIMPGDLVAIVRTSAGVGALQQFTSDKRQLYAATEHIRSGGQTLLDTLKGCQTNSFSPTLDPQTNAPTEKNSGSEFDGFSEQSYFNGSLGAINFIVAGLREVPGRKALVLFSEGLVLCPEERAKLGTLFEERLRKIADLANRASVVVYTIDPRGLIAFGDASEGGSSNVANSMSRLSNASAALFESQGSFNQIVDATGGFGVYNNNDIPAALGRVINDQKGYYLIGYRPNDESFDSDKGQLRFNDLKVKLKRPGLKVRTRSGFFGVAQTKTRTVKHTREDQLLSGLTSPFKSGDIDVRLTSLFGNEPAGSFMLSMLHIDPAGLTFAAQADGWQQAVMDVLAITFDADGQIVEQLNKTQTIRVRGSAYQRLMKNGIVYSLSVPIKKPGAYQLRIAVRDSASEKVGSSGQFIEVPNLAKNQLALSGIAVYTGARSETTSGTATNVAPDVTANQPPPAPGTRDYEPQPGPAYRRFHQKSILEYDYAIYNATTNAGPPQLKTRITVTRDGQEVLTGQEKVFDLTGQSDFARLKGGGRLLLGEALPPGEYTLKVTVVDVLAKKERNTVTQWIDFEIVQ